MPRALSLYLPMWSIDLVRRRNRSLRATAAAPSAARRNGAPSRRDPRLLADAREAPTILLVRTVAGVQRIAARCERAAATGIRETMTLAHARALKREGDEDPADIIAFGTVEGGRHGRVVRIKGLNGE